MVARLFGTTPTLYGETAIGDCLQRVMALLGRLKRDRATQRCDEPEAQPVGG